MIATATHELRWYTLTGDDRSMVGAGLSLRGGALSHNRLFKSRYMRATVPGSQIPRTLFGSFLEPIGNATYNGLWAEVLQNPSFESGLWSVASAREMTMDNPELGRSSQMGLPLPWESLHPDQDKPL